MQYIIELLLDKHYFGKVEVTGDMPLLVGFYRLYLDYFAAAASVFLTAWISLHASL